MKEGRFEEGSQGRSSGFIRGNQPARWRVTCVGRGAPCHFMLGKGQPGGCVASDLVSYVDSCVTNGGHGEIKT